MSFDLDAYLARLTLGARPSPDAEGLARVQRAHRQAIPFENLDIILGRGVGIDNASVAAKLVTARRGGYCFEHNRLFGDALAAIGFKARPLLGRVWARRPEATPGLTHTLSLVAIDGQDWVADPGFGGRYAPPMPVMDGAMAEGPDGARCRLTADETYGWMLARDGGEGWQDQYSFTLDTVWDADLAIGNHWCATSADSHFTQDPIVSVVLPNGFASLTGTAYHRRNGAEETRAEITDPRVYRLRLSMMFGLELSAEDVAGLGLFIP